MLRSGLMPRILALLGVIGGPIRSLAGIGVLFDLYEASGTVQSILTIPEIIWELSLGIYPLIWGFKRSPILSEEGRPAEIRGAHRKRERAVPPPASSEEHLVRI